MQQNVKKNKKFNMKRKKNNWRNRLLKKQYRNATLEEISDDSDDNIESVKRIALKIE